MRAVLLALPLGALLGAQNPEASSLQGGLSAFSQSFSDTTGPWRGAGMEVSYGPAGQAWTASFLRLDRPEGEGNLGALGKQWSFGTQSWVSLGLAAGDQALYLPEIRGEVDTNLGLAGPLGLGLQAGWSRFQGGETLQQAQAGPSLSLERWSFSARAQWLRYNPGAYTDTGYLVDLQHGGGEGEAWQSLRLAWGPGILEAVQGGSGILGPTGGGGPGAGTGTGGSGTGSGGGSGWGWRRGSGTLAPDPMPQPAAAALQAEGEVPDERLVSLLIHQPVTSRTGLLAEASWGERKGIHRTWSFSLQVVRRF